MADHLKGIKKVYFAPDGVYQKLNLGVLPNDQGRVQSESVNFVRMASTGDLARPWLGADAKVQGALLVGRPDYGLSSESRKAVLGGSTVRGSDSMTGVGDLPGTQQEVEAIAALYPVGQARELLGTGALEDRVKAVKGVKVLHLATHGFFEEVKAVKRSDGPELLDGMRPKVLAADQDPMRRSAVLLAGAGVTLQGGSVPEGVDDGVLTAYEALGMDLYGCQLVVLSACETGLGEVKNGEGVYGLQRAIQAAGARNILMSLWKVDDRATREFMTGFYGAWLGGQTVEQAYDTARTEVRARYPDPKDWGAFVLVTR